MVSWIIMVIALLIIPLSMFGFGISFLKSAPKSINTFFGYRTARSMKNMETWAFAHRYFGKTWRVCGAVMVPLTVVAMLPALGKSPDTAGILSMILLGLDFVAIFQSSA